MWKHKNFINLQLCATFKHFYDAGTIGSGTYKFRHYSQTEPLPQLATPQNVAINGTTLSWDAVENATSYDIYADGTLIGNITGQEPTPQVPKVSIKYTDDYVSGYIAYSLDNGATWSDYIATQTTLLTDVTQIKLKSRGLSAGLMIYKGPYGYNGESGVATTVVSPGYPDDTRAYETENITITEDTGFYLYCYYD